MPVPTPRIALTSLSLGLSAAVLVGTAAPAQALAPVEQAHPSAMYARASALHAPASALPAKPRPPRFGRAIEAMPSYQPQEWCSPIPKPGTRRLAKHLLARYPGTHSDGISRACTAGGRSEHKEGRAFDWGVSVRNAVQQRQAWNFLGWLFGPDRFGHRRAMARRMGIMYVIWSGHIFNTDAPPRRYSGASAHGDHMHISQNWSGAMARTSFWSGHVASSSWRPPPPVRRTPMREVFGLPTGKRGAVSTKARLRSGGLYRVRVSGVYYTGRGMADAECTRDPRSGIWRRFDPRHPWYERFDVHINGANPQLRPSYGTGCAVRTHTYTTTVRARKTKRMSFGIRDPRPRDNVGQLVVSVVRLR